MQLVNRRLDLSEAEIRIVDGVGVTGRLMGPRCEYSSTVEVAYYVRPAPDGGLRVIVPEPSFWDPQSPFLYEAILQAADGTKVVRRHGLRRVQLSAAGLRVNRRPFRVAGVYRESLDDAASLRAAGIDTILCPVSDATKRLWDQADVLGFFVIGMLGDVDAMALARTLKEHACCLGWIVSDVDLVEPQSLQTHRGQEPLLGLKVETPPASLPTWVQFLASESPLESGPPWLLIDDGTQASAGSIGTIRR